MIIQNTTHPSIYFLFIFSFISGCSGPSPEKEAAVPANYYQDSGFIQEYHEAWALDSITGPSPVRSILVDHESTVWITTATGVYTKNRHGEAWQSRLTGEDRGPAYALLQDDDKQVWIGAWNGLYKAVGHTVEKTAGIEMPVSVLCRAKEGLYALGPQGIWLLSDNQWEKKEYKVARTIRAAVSDEKGGLWIGTDAGLFHVENQEAHYIDESKLISAYITGLSYRGEDLWIGGLGGVTIHEDGKLIEKLDPSKGIPSSFVNTVERSPGGVMWVGTNTGVVRYSPDGSHSLRFSRRWLLDDVVNDVAFDARGDAWIATNGGVSVIRQKEMTLAEKASYFYSNLMRRHIRPPWIAGHARLTIPGDTSSLVPEDDDNDGSYTAIYMAMECLRYAVTKEEDAAEKARKAFNFLTFLQTVTRTEGFFARTVVPADWGPVNDANRTYTKQQMAELLVREPAFKPLEKRWIPSEDGKWLWKRDTSSDEVTGHLFGYVFFYEFVANEEEKLLMKSHMTKIMDYLIKHDYNFVDIDGAHTRWAVWSPGKLNRDPDWFPEQAVNSLELLALLKFTWQVSRDEKYNKEYHRLIQEEHYLENAKKITRSNPAWFTYINASLTSQVFPALLLYEDDETLKKEYEQLIDQWIGMYKNIESPFFNFIYCFLRNKKVEVQPSVDFLLKTPLDLVDWTIDHTPREDIYITRSPQMETLQTSELQPADIRAVVRWDKNPWDAINGTPWREREPVFWLFPYWMGRYLEVIKP